MKSKTILLPIFSICLLVLVLAGCDKDGLVDRRSVATNTKMMFVHAVPEAVQFNFYLNDVKLTGAVENATTLLPQGMGYNTANQPPYFGYCNVTPGTAKIRAVVPQNYGVAANDTIPAGTVLSESTKEIGQDQLYTVLAYGTARAVSELFLKDELIRTAGKVGIRFINLMPGAIPVDLEMTYTAPGSITPVISKLATNIAYGEFTEFTALDPGNYVFQRKRTGTNTLVGTATTITRLNASQNFTLCARGTLAAMLQIPHQ